MTRRKTHEQYIEEVFLKHGDKYTVLGRYNNQREKILIKCNICNHEWEPVAYSIIHKTKPKGCPECGKKNIARKNLSRLLAIAENKKITKSEFTKRLKEKFQNKITIFGDFINMKLPVTFKCDKNHVFTTKPHNIISKKTKIGCPYCANCVKRTADEFKNIVKTLGKNEYTILGEYKNSSTKIKIKHKQCGFEYLVRPIDFINGYRCGNCSTRKKKSHEEFENEVYQLVGSEYTILSKYENTMSKILIKHKTCGNTYKVTPNMFLRGNRCPYCKESKGEKLIAKILELYNVIYNRQFAFESCKNITKLRFDFSIKSKETHFLVEYDGIQHFIPSFGKDSFLRTKATDQIKNQYCIQNDIPLIRIPYWEYDNIEYILEHVLAYFRLIDKQDVDKDLVHKFLVNHPDWSHEKYISQAS
ncbi:hypothetical protein EDM57_04335 [Brevibacillus gelatini]|uniref:DUF2726 domain-containing protein n=1 Tax=Brevibacillus gelatini TaxID=1655277 RepID=A0A3M8B8R0_9BACL|nr:zinc-ribbon domain-containing protein [Brevibacillus gelatini]RNB59377.1 hypothetical protein EDM57_04335 [Brevibacillus gelatini]